MCSSVVVRIHNIIQINSQLVTTLVSLLSEGNGVEFIQEGFIEPLSVTISPGMFYLGRGVPYPKSVACLLNFVGWYFFLMPGGILCSTIGKDSLSLLE